jgi:uncharacterized protein YceH (UPF0502 family)
MSDEPISPAQPAAPPRWQPIGPIDRRVAGVLVEKAKTVSSAYPMTLNAIATAANQKSNRFPLMDLEPDAVEESLERLRGLGAVGLVQGYGRVAKYRHYLYEWLGVEKVEIAVMAELLLRGAQTEGELRIRASRMEPIADLPAMRAVLTALEFKGLVVWLTPEWRGRVVSHTLYTPREMEDLLAQFAPLGRAGVVPGAEPPAIRCQEPFPAEGLAASRDVSPETVPDTVSRELDELRSQLAQLRRDLDELSAAQRETDDQVQRLRRDLGA